MRRRLFASAILLLVASVLFYLAGSLLIAVGFGVLQTEERSAIFSVGTEVAFVRYQHPSAIKHGLSAHSSSRGFRKLLPKACLGGLHAPAFEHIRRPRG